MWRVLNKLFGWDYAHFSFGFGYVVRRIYTHQDGTKYALCCGYLIKEGESEWFQLT